MTGILRSREVALLLVNLLIVAGVGLRAPVFLTPASLSEVLTDTAILAMLALAQTAVILTRGIDLSVAANLALTGMLVALFSRWSSGTPILAVIVLGILVGAALGAVNGALVAGLGIPPIVVTLGTMAVYRGLIFVVAGGQWVTSQGMSEAFLAIPKAKFLGISSLVWIAAAVTAGFWLFLTQTRTGRGLYAIGGNPVAARFCGIAPGRLTFLVYVLSGAMSGLAGYLWASRYGIAYADLAIGYELTVIAACVIGGVSIAGGIGTVPGVLLGALFLGIVANGLPVINVSPFWQMAISGAVILAAVILNAGAERRTGKLILPEARRAAAAGRG
ncbi:ABC transporter permease [Prosthecomicrobium sp. N25]|uniref:ABC transporter permease n=1 Tax=Prosthecomicrobium sp. N25 TaxID=3129254 RepID=UPI003077A88F